MQAITVFIENLLPILLIISTIGITKNVHVLCFLNWMSSNCCRSHKFRRSPEKIEWLFDLDDFSEFRSLNFII